MTTANTSSKQCFKCGAVKHRAEFYKHPAMADGLLGKCKACTKKDSTARRNENLEEVREYDRERAKNPQRIAKAAEIRRRWLAEDKRRGACHGAVARAVRSGAISWAPCCKCGSEASMAHHESYDRPLDVVWYCQVHHKERHKQMAIEGICP